VALVVANWYPERFGFRVITMEQPPKLPVNNEQPSSPPDGGGLPTAARFLLGLAAGSVISLAVWPWWWRSANQNSNNGNFVYVIVAVPAAKVVAAVICFYFPRWRPFAAGLLVSLAVGFLIFFGACAVNLKLNV